MAYTRLKQFVVFVFVIVMTMSLATLPQRVIAQPTELRIAIKPLTPFVIKEGETSTGFSIDLWREIAVRNGWKYKFEWNETVTQLLERVQKGNADVGIAGISMTADREEKIDFSLSMFNAGLQIMVGKNIHPNLGTAIMTIFTPDLLRVLAILVLAVVVVGHVVWLSERNGNANFPKGYVRGVWEGIWLAGMTLATVGYGERSPKTVVGRLGSLLWMFTAIVLIAYFTATVTTALTLQQIQGNISGPADLPGKHVLSIEGSTASAWLTARGINHTDVKGATDAYPILAEHKADAFVYDAPVLLYAANRSDGVLEMVGPIFKQEQYGIVMPNGSPLRKSINHALLEIYSDGTYQQIYAKWFGSSNTP